ncbi:hypothetical protein U8527_06795 [Kordia algicida OT-1]|uniref:Lipoprotein n=1 Tax=Kordia algicida OT-1 TaxID=391587 RepID=A9E978_9FLAO|nr:hypothetical protein [Kordia algicida]EDP94647.1 hypothetical protein KAOT1_00185 [Kordia algicida OT-1]
MRRTITLILSCLLIFSCKTITVNQKSQLLTKTRVELGSIGLVNGSMITSNYESIAIPTFDKELKLNVQAISFSKNTFKAFAKANQQPQKVALHYVDSLEIKPKYVLLQFVDRVAITEALNNPKNTGLRSYLENKEDAQMVSSISIAFPENKIRELEKASEVFLVQSPSKKFSLKLKSFNGKYQTLEFAEGVVFAYQTSSFCWKENSKHKLVIADIVSGLESCPPNTYRKSQKAVQKNDYFKL